MPIPAMTFDSTENTFFLVLAHSRGLGLVKLGDDNEISDRTHRLEFRQVCQE